MLASDFLYPANMVLYFHDLIPFILFIISLFYLLFIHYLSLIYSIKNNKLLVWFKTMPKRNGTRLAEWREYENTHPLNLTSYSMVKLMLHYITSRNTYYVSLCEKSFIDVGYNCWFHLQSNSGTHCYNEVWRMISMNPLTVR